MGLDLVKYGTPITSQVVPVMILEIVADWNFHRYTILSVVSFEALILDVYVILLIFLSY